MTHSAKPGFNKPCLPGSLKAAAAEVLAAATVPQAEYVTGRRKTALYGWADPDSDRHMPLDVAAKLTAATGNLSVAAALAAEAGAVVLPAAALGGPAELAADVGALCDKVGAAVRDYGQAIADGMITDGERARLLADFRSVADAAMAAYADLTRLPPPDPEAPAACRPALKAVGG